MTPKQKNGWKKAGRIIGTLLLVFVVTLAIFAGIFMAYINSAMRGKVEVYLDEFETQVSTELYYQDPDTGEWVMYQTLYLDSENRIWTDLEDIPKYLQEAAIAIEDKRFEKHHGVDWRGTTRAIRVHPVRQERAGRLHHHPAAGEERHRRQRGDGKAKDHGDLPRAGAGKALRERTRYLKPT